MTLTQVHQEWHKYLAQVENETRFLSKKQQVDAKYDLIFGFNSMLAAEKPVLVTGHVPRQLGWSAATHWGNLATVVHTAVLRVG